MQKRIINSFLFLFAIHASVANAQVYAYVEQKEDNSKEQKKEVSVEVTTLGKAIISTRYITPTVQFINGKAVMKIGKSTVASVSVIDGGVLVVEPLPLPFDKNEEEEIKNNNKITKSPSKEKPYVTVYSPFQLVVPTGCEVYAPEYDASTQMLRLNSGNQIPAGAIVPAETPLVVKGHRMSTSSFQSMLPPVPLKPTSVAPPYASAHPPMAPYTPLVATRTTSRSTASSATFPPPFPQALLI